MSKKLVLGTGNKGKIKEFQNLLPDENLTLLSWKDFDYSFSVVEDGKTFQENALKKAEITARVTGEISIADDSGLEVDFLECRPGIFSARFAGPNASDEENNAKLLKEMEAVPTAQRGARFVCVIVICSPTGKWEGVEGERRGVITEAPRGENGFGYDPLFFVPELGKTFAELSREEKNQISHRAEAVKKFRPFLKKYFPEK